MNSSSTNSEHEIRVFRSTDPIRGLFNDTLPIEVPVFFSNISAHENLTRLFGSSFRENIEYWKTSQSANSETDWMRILVATHFDVNKEELFEKPYQVDTVTTTNKRRRIWLPHFRSQFRNSLFMHDHQGKILYYTGMSSCTLRAPSKLGPTNSSHGVKYSLTSFRRLGDHFSDEGAQANQVETVPEEWVRHFFVYRKTRRLFQFFDSPEFTRLEEQFPFLLLLDVQSAFSSIYTHSISWAIRGQEHSKDLSKGANHSPKLRDYPFGHEFDRIMQKSNWNETNGIVVGPELSRIFAEIIFQRIDADGLADANKRLGLDSDETAAQRFRVLRYVDDYFVFAQSQYIADVIKHSLAKTLDIYKLEFNSSKTELLQRPFLSGEGQLSHDVSQLIRNRMSELSAITNEIDPLTPRQRANKLSNWRKGFIADIRATCKLHGMGLSLTMSRIPAAIRERSFRLLMGKDPLPVDIAAVRADLAWTLADLCGYLLSLQKTEAATVSFCTCVLVCLRLNVAAGGILERTPQLERLFERCREILSAMTTEFNEDTRDHQQKRLGNLCICNLIACMSEIPAPLWLHEKELQEFLNFDPNRFTEEHYFELITILYYCSKTQNDYSNSDSLVNRLVELINQKGLTDAGLSYSFFDTMSCPIISKRSKRKLLVAASSNQKVSQSFIRTNASKDLVTDEFTKHPWFVNWTSNILMLQMFRRKTAVQVY